MPTTEEKSYANAFNLLPSLGPIRLEFLRNQFGSFERAWRASRADYVKVGLNPKITEAITTHKLATDVAAEFDKLSKHGIEIILSTESDYPSLLKEISAFPPLLYVRGNKQILNSNTIAVVGTRKMTAYGRAATEEISTGLLNSGLTIVSGLAFGVDAATLAIAASRGAPSIAVQASPIDDGNITPKSNYQLAREILKSGCIVTEHPLGASVQKQNFPIRNRIISGLSLGTVVIEADLESGALITANYALEQNREVFAIPGSIFSQVSAGTNDLIKRGAKLVSSYQDVLAELNLDTILPKEVEIDQNTTSQEQLIIENLSREPVHIDDLTRQIQIPASEVSAALAMLEMKGRVRNLGGAKYSKIR